METLLFSFRNCCILMDKHTVNKVAFEMLLGERGRAKGIGLFGPLPNGRGSVARKTEPRPLGSGLAQLVS